MLGARLATLLKEYAWVLNLVFIALMGYYVAGATNAVVARLIRVVPGADDVPTGGAGGALKPSSARKDFEAINRRNLFQALVENILPVSAAAAAVDAGGVSGRDYVYDQLKKCTMGAVVRATLVADGTPEWSMAVIVPNATHETGVYSILEGRNHIVDDAYLVDVLYREVVIRRRDHFEKCIIEGFEGAEAGTTMASTTAVAPAAEAVAADGNTPEPAGGGVQKLSANDYEVDGSYLDQTLANLNEIATQARLVPSFKDGKANGFKMFSIKPGSIYSKIGMQNGDVIQKINGFELNSPEKGLELFSKLRDSTSVSIDVLRRGQPSTMNYKIRR